MLSKMHRFALKRLGLNIFPNPPGYVPSSPLYITQQWENTRCIRVGHGNLLRVATQCFHQPSNIKRISEDAQVEIKKLESIKVPDEPTTCCMSGCANCVWIEYAEKLSEVLGSAGPHKAKEIILERVSDPNVRAYLLMELKILENRLT